MEPKFKVAFLEDAIIFLDTLEPKAREKIIYNIRKAQVINDNELFKKLTNDIWEFRTLYNKTYYRLFAFWDKRGNADTIVVSTHGLVKKTGKTPKTEIEIERETMKHQGIKTISLEAVTDKYIGQKGTPERENFENELRLDLLGEAVKNARKQRNLTQEELGKLVGVQKAQISKIENSLSGARFETILKVFNALNVRISFNIEFLDHTVKLA